MKLQSAALWAAGGLILIILLQNTQVLTMRLLFWEVSMSRIIFVPVILAVGFIFGFILGRNSW